MPNRLIMGRTGEPRFWGAPITRGVAFRSSPAAHLVGMEGLER